MNDCIVEINIENIDVTFFNILTLLLKRVINLFSSK